MYPELVREHPCNFSVGYVRLEKQLQGKRNRISAFLQKAGEYTEEVRDLMREVYIDVADLLTMVIVAMDDGVITRTEYANILTAIKDLKKQVETGRIE